MRVPGFVSRSLDALGFSAHAGVRAKLNRCFTQRAAVREALNTEPRFSFGQFGEDAVLQALLPEGPGTYIDIGSGHPIRGSNTYALYQRGWNGLLVDALTSHVALSRKLRPRDLVVQALCGERDGEPMTFYEYDTYELSTVSQERVQELQEIGYLPSRTHELETVSLASLARRIEPQGTTVLSIDVEGADLSVLRGNDWDAFTPHFIMIEEWKAPLDGQSKVHELLAPLSYSLVAVASVTSIYKHEARL